MANTARTITAGATHADTLYLGGSAETVKFQGALKYSAGTTVADGNNQATAVALTYQVTYVTAADGTKGVKLPTAAAGLVYEVYNMEASNLLRVYPNTSDDINDGTTNVHINIQGHTAARFVALDDTTWAMQNSLDWVAADVTLADGVDITFATGTGTKIGTGATQKIGFYNATPIVQPAHADQAAVGTMTAVGTNNGTGGAGLSAIAATNTGDRSAEIMNDFKALQEDVVALAVLANALRTALVNSGLLKGSA